MRTATLSAILFAAIAAALAVGQAPSDSDMFWHLTSGEWMLDHGQILDRDLFSYTREGQPYSVGQWLGQIVLALAYRAGGWLGIDVLRAALVGVATFFLARLTLRVQPHVGWAALPILSTVLVSRLVWGERPQLFTLALFALVLDVVLATRADGRVWRLALLPPLFLVWANLHNAFVLGIAILAIATIDTLLERVAGQRRAFVLALVGALALAQVNPAGAGAIGRAVAYGALLPDWIVEDRPLDVLSPAGVLFATLLLLALGAALACGREGIADRLGAPLLWPGLIPVFTVLALAIQRETPYACIVLGPFVAAMVPDALGRPRVADLLVPRAAALAACVALAAALVSFAALTAPREPDLSRYPVGALARLDPLRGNLLNEYDWGGYLIRYSPAHPTFVDGRGEALFVPDVVRDFQTVAKLRSGYREVLARWDIRVALLRPDRPLAGALSEDGWRVRGEEPGRWILLERP